MDNKTCGRCGVDKPASAFNKSKYAKTGLRSQCRDCMREERARLQQHYKEWRDTPERKAWYAAYRKSKYDPVKAKARNMVARAVGRGELVRAPCEKCGDPKSEAHHDDYSKPLDVRWLCESHHAEWHRNNKAIYPELLHTFNHPEPAGQPAENT